MTTKIELTLAASADQINIDHIRHDIYAAELGQFHTSTDGILRDTPEVESIYIAAFINQKLVGFVAVTPPTSPGYSIDKYIARPDTGLSFDASLYEIRTLTVIDSSRGSIVAPALMYAAFRWIQANGGKQLVAIGHEKVKPMYLRLGMRRAGKKFNCGMLEYELLAAAVKDIEAELTRFNMRLGRLEKQVDWKLGIPFRPAVECYHGGAFFEAVGNSFDHLERRNEIINADVLDAWYPPCPEALKALHEHLGWLMRTSPPNHAEGLVGAIAAARGVKPENILCGGGSSPLIFLAFRQWLAPDSKVLLFDPTYGEYTHVLEKVIGCHVDRFKLDRTEGYAVKLERLKERLKDRYDQIVWVNPNSPTGRHVARSDVESILERCPTSTRIWIDETYVEYAGQGQSLEQVASKTDNVVVVKSMSKVYGLSGLRVGYLCGSPAQLEPLRGLTPPWSVSLPAQVAAIHALKAPDYYRNRYDETHRFRARLIAGLRRLGIEEIIPGVANFVLFHLPAHAPDAERVMEDCRKQGLFIRDAAEMGTGMGDRALRIAVKDTDTNERMLLILGNAMNTTTRKELCHA
jgi:histidinol-phosphate/aromatic aminotransferase/cobyric acid decarboxylase-like protein